MALTPQEVRQVSVLARLNLADDEAERLTHHLNDLLAQFDTLQSLNTEGVAPTSHAVPIKALLREDEIQPSLSRDAVMGLSKHVDELLGGFIVPQVLPGDGGGV
jgi:aspartyl-tRNA(Asn)/glutamyl-tRNA(Gln) amidotransferase subunit C